MFSGCCLTISSKVIFRRNKGCQLYCMVLWYCVRSLWIIGRPYVTMTLYYYLVGSKPYRLPDASASAENKKNGRERWSVPKVCH